MTKSWRNQDVQIRRWKSLAANEAKELNRCPVIKFRRKLFEVLTAWETFVIGWAQWREAKLPTFEECSILLSTLKDKWTNFWLQGKNRTNQRKGETKRTKLFKNQIARQANCISQKPNTLQKQNMLTQMKSSTSSTPSMLNQAGGSGPDIDGPGRIWFTPLSSLYRPPFLPEWGIRTKKGPLELQDINALCGELTRISDMGGQRSYQ